MLLGEMALVVVIEEVMRISGIISVLSSATVSRGFFFSFLNCVNSPSAFLEEEEEPAPRKNCVGGSLFLDKNG